MGSRAVTVRLLGHRGSRSLLTVLCVLFTSGFTQVPAKSVAPQTNRLSVVSRPEDSLILLSVHMAGISVSPGLEAYQYPGGVLVPLGEICRCLELSVNVNVGLGTADGFVRIKNRPFRLDLAKHTANLNGVALPFDSAGIELHRNDIYIDAKILSTWFDLGLKVDVFGSDISVQPGEPLPIQLRLERDRQGKLATSGFSTYRDPGFPVVPNPYQMFGGPSFDQTFGLSLGPKGTGLDAHYSALLAADVERQGLTAFLQLDSGSTLANGSVSVGQTDPDGHLLGSLHAREVAVGQFYVPAFPLLWDTHLESGLLVSSYPIDRSSQFDVTSFSGVLLAGWDVQLFLGTALVDYQMSNSSGRYTFKNVPLAFGVNYYRLVFHGPGGEQRVETKTSNIANELVAPGENWYRVVVDPSFESASPISARTDLGLTGNVSTTVGLATTTLTDGPHTYGSLGLQAFTLGVRGYAEMTSDPKSGTAEEVGVQWFWKETSVTLNQLWVQDLRSELLLQNLDPIKSQTRLQIGNIAMPRWSGMLPTDLYLAHEKTRGGIERWEIRDRMSFQSHGYSITDWFDWRQQTGQGISTQGQVLVTRWGDGPLLQGAIHYSWTDALSINQLSLQIRRFYANQRVLTYGMYETPMDRNLGVTASLARSFGTYTYGYTVDVSKLNGIVLGLSLSFGTVRNPQTNQWKHTASSQATLGAVLVRVFRDVNGSGKLDPGEEVLEDVGVFANNLPIGRHTAKDGTVLIDSLPAYKPVDLRVAEATLSNPLWVSSRVGVRITPRPGNVPVLDFPIVCTGEVTGTVFELKDGATEPIGGVSLELVGAKGQILATQVSAFDGYFAFQKVGIGISFVRTASTSRYRAVGDGLKITIPPAGVYLDGLKLVVEAKVPGA